MQYEPYKVYDSQREQRRRANNRNNQKMSNSIKSRQELTEISSTLAVYTINGKTKLKEFVKKAAPCSDGEFVVSEELKSINHQYLYKLLNALNALNFNIRFINCASKFGKFVKLSNNSLIQIDLDYLKHSDLSSFKIDPNCFKNNIQDTEEIIIPTEYLVTSLPEEEFEKLSKKHFRQGLISAIEHSIRILKYWYNKIINLQIPISQNFDASITRSINNAQILIEQINNETINLEPFRKSLNITKINVEENNF